MRDLKSQTFSITGTIVGGGGAASATLHTFSSSAGDSPGIIDMFCMTTPNYTAAQTTRLFIMSGRTSTAMWSGTAVNESTAKNEALSGYDVWVEPGDYILGVTGGDVTDNATLTVWVKMRS